MSLLKCTENKSKTLPFLVGNMYLAEDLGGGLYEIGDDGDSYIIAPLDGYYVKFEIVKPIGRGIRLNKNNNK